MTLSEAKRYHAYARECLQVAEEAESAEVQASLSELSQIWMEAALKEESRDLQVQRIGRPSREICPVVWSCFESPRRLRNRRAEGGRDDHGSVVGGKACPDSPK